MHGSRLLKYLLSWPYREKETIFLSVPGSKEALISENRDLRIRKLDAFQYRYLNNFLTGLLILAMLNYKPAWILIVYFANL